MNARSRIHAMFSLDEHTETELDLRLDAHEAEVTRTNAALLEDRACDADFTQDPQFIAGLRTGVELLLWAAGQAALGQAAAATPSTVRFEGPTPHAPRGAKARQAFADELRARPKEWALLGAYSGAGSARQAAYGIRRVNAPQDEPFAPAGSFEAEARSMCGEHRIYVRFVGGEGV